MYYIRKIIGSGAIYANYMEKVIHLYNFVFWIKSIQVAYNKNK